jgi:hypothetical protein
VNLTISRSAVLWRRSLATVCVALAGSAYGCGSGQEQEKVGTVDAAKVLKEEQLYRYVGEGKDKRKEPISIRERAKLLREAEKKSQ